MPSKVGVRTIIVDGLVAAVDGGQIILNVGAKAGVNVGDQLEVVRVTKEIKDPATGHVIRASPPPSARSKPPTSTKYLPICTPVSGTDFKAGDRVKTITQ